MYAERFENKDPSSYMTYIFEWHASLDATERTTFEAKLLHDLKSEHTPKLSCHDGRSVVSIGQADPLGQNLVGNVRCSCGSPVARIDATRNASNVRISRLHVSRSN